MNSIPETPQEISYGFCHCGCGQRTVIADRTSRRDGTVRDQPKRYIHGHNSARPPSERFWENVDRSGGPDACWPWTGAKNNKGYGQMRVNGKSMLAHRYAFEDTYGPLAPGMEVCHRCDNPACCNAIAHHFEGTHADNFADAAVKGRMRHGENHPMHKLTEEQVRAIRSDYAAGKVTLTTLATRHSVTCTAIFMIVNERSWRHTE